MLFGGILWSWAITMCRIAPVHGNMCHNHQKQHRILKRHCQLLVDALRSYVSRKSEYKNTNVNEVLCLVNALQNYVDWKIRKIQLSTECSIWGDMTLFCISSLRLLTKLYIVMSPDCKSGPRCRVYVKTLWMQLWVICMTDCLSDWSGLVVSQV